MQRRPPPDVVEEDAAEEDEGAMPSVSKVFTEQHRAEISRALLLGDIGEMDSDALIERYEALKERYTVEPTSVLAMRDWVYDRFDCDELKPDGPRNEEILGTAYDKALLEILDVSMQLSMRGLDSGDREEVLYTCSEVLFRANRIISQEFAMRATMQGEMSAGSTEVTVDNFSSQFKANKSRFTDLQHLMLYLLDCTRDRNLRKRGDMLYSEIKTDDGHHTRAWEQHGTLLEFIHQCCDRDTHFQQWQWMTSNPGNASSLALYMINCKDRSLPAYEPNRYFISFRNGIYAVACDTFYNRDKPLSPDIVAITFIDREFPEHLCEVGEDGNLPDPSDIDIPCFDKIFTHQRLGEDVTFWLMAFLGRVMYDNGAMDNWQKLLFIKGMAGTGKSTIGHIFEWLYGEHLGVISSNIEPQFGLESLLDKLMWMCYEVKTDFRLDQGQLQSMSSRDPVVVARKHKIALVVRRWIASGLLLGNEWAKRWADAAGALSRRLAIIFFDWQVIDSDPDMRNKLFDNMGAIIVKMNRSYIHALLQCGDDPVDKHLPPYFLQTQKKLEMETNPLLAFLTQCPEIEVNPDAYITLSDFTSVYTRWCKDNAFPIVRITDEHKVKRTFEKIGIQQRTAKLPYGRSGEMKQSIYLMGVQRSEGSGYGGGGGGGDTTITLRKEMQETSVDDHDDDDAVEPDSSKRPITARRRQPARRATVDKYPIGGMGSA